MLWTRKQNRGFVSQLLLLYLIHKTQVTSAFVVPSQLPGVLTLLEHPAKAGIDSRLGFGFRLGNNTDFQLVLELGPQTKTRSIGEPSKNNKSSNKRQLSFNDKKSLLSQPLRQQVQEPEMLKASNERNTASWLKSWSKDMKPQKTKTKSVKVSPPRNLQGQLASIQQLQLLYKLATTSNSSSTKRATTSAMNPDQKPNPDSAANPDPATNPDLATYIKLCDPCE